MKFANTVFELLKNEMTSSLASQVFSRLIRYNKDLLKDQSTDLIN